jgi:hypothetical protein
MLRERAVVRWKLTVDKPNIEGYAYEKHPRGEHTFYERRHSRGAMEH